MSSGSSPAPHGAFEPAGEDLRVLRIATPPRAARRSEAELRTLLDGLTLRQKAALTAGSDYWRTTAVPEAGIASLKFSDGPVGARGDLSSGATSTCYPCGAAVGATWDTDLASELGAALAEEAAAKGAHVLLAPTVNLHRHPLAGRNFECMSEDPELTARLASALIGGLQSQGIGASIKHYVANDQETERMSVSAEVDERTLRELYLRPFEAAVAEAGPWTIMAAYNKVNGVHATEHRRLLAEILKREWGWDGAVISDWWATRDTARAAQGGLDLEMPGPPAWLGPRLASAVEDGEVTEAALDEMALRVLRLLDRAGRLDDTADVPETDGESAERTALARRAAQESIVLLTNSGILPLAPSVRSVAVIGPAAHPGFEQGGGSALVWPHRRVSPLDGLRSALPGVDVSWDRGCPLGRFAPPLHPDLLADGGWQASFWGDPEATGDPVHTTYWPEVRYSYFGRKVPGVSNPSSMRARFQTTVTPDQTGAWRFHLVCAGRASVTVAGTEILGHDEDAPLMAIFPVGLPALHADVHLEAGVPVDVVVELSVSTPACLPQLYVGATPPSPDLEIERAAARAAAADVAVVVIGTGPEFESEGQDRTTLAVPGHQNRLVEAVLAAQPNTVVVVAAGAPLELPWADRVPAVVWAWFGGQEAGHALGDVLTGAADPGGRLPVTFPVRLEDTPAFTNHPGESGSVRYGEGLFIGYRWYTARDLAPAFPFGHGGSYTTVELGSPTATVGADGSVTVDVVARNTGDRAGVEVVQVYAEAADLPLASPPLQLAGFAKVRLEVGESRTVSVHVPARALAHWDVVAGAWRVPAGRRGLRVGRSSADLAHHVEIDLQGRLLATPQP